jgi:penicillin-binding protein 1A
VTLLELTGAYGVFANAGMSIPPIFITKIVNPQGKVLVEHFPEAQRVVDPEVAYVMTSMLEDVIDRGTGRPVRALGRPVAGKTGTTNDFRDAWFLGYTPELVTGVWVGIDDRTTLGDGETGGRAASPIWLEFMQEALRDQPVTDFVAPPGVRFVRGGADKGTPVKLSNSSETFFEVFIEDAEPFAASKPGSGGRRRARPPDANPASLVRSTGEPASPDEPANGSRASATAQSSSDVQRRLRSLDRGQPELPHGVGEASEDVRGVAPQGVN